MPLIIALIVGLGSFFGYTTVQSHAADKALHNIERTLDQKEGKVTLDCANFCEGK